MLKKLHTVHDRGYEIMQYFDVRLLKFDMRWLEEVRALRPRLKNV